MTNAWSPTLIAIKVKISENQKLIVINQYIDGLNIKRCDENLETLVQSVKQLYGNIPILIGGDFNRKSNQKEKMEEALNLHIAEREQGSYTWSQKGKKKSSIDYFLSTQKLTQISQTNMNP